MNIPEPAEQPINKFHDLQNRQIINRLDNLREWQPLSDNGKDLLEEVSRRFLEAENRYIPYLHTVFPSRSEHPKLNVVFTEFRKHPDPTYEDEGLLDIYCRVDKEGGGVEYWAQTFDREFKPTSERMAPVTKELIIGLMQDRITKV